MHVARDGGLMPVTLRGADTADLHRISTSTVASAQVKSALLLAALNAPGRSRIAQNALTRDHTEKMLRAFGAEIYGRAAGRWRRSRARHGRSGTATLRDDVSRAIRLPPRFRWRPR